MRYLQTAPPFARQASSTIDTALAPHILSASLYQPITVRQSVLEKVSAPWVVITPSPGPAGSNSRWPVS